MMFLSILAKTFALALLGGSPAVAAGLWAGGALLDFPWRRAPGALRGFWVLQAASLMIGLALAFACDAAAVRWKEGIPVLAAPVAWLLELVGANCGANRGSVFLSTMAGPLEFGVSLDTLAAKVPVVFCGLFWARLLWSGIAVGESLRRLGVCAAAMLACAVLRMAAFVICANAIFDFTGYDSGELPYRPFMEESARLLSWLPFMALVWVPLGRLLKALDAAGDAATGRAMPPWVKWAAPPVAVALGALVFWQPAGEAKARGRIVIASGHAQWSQCARPYDRDWYGADSGYNYACMKRLFGFFAPVALADGPAISAADLRDASVLVVYDPDRAFTATERELIRGFVEDGGGLFVIGDHTNVFGSSTHLNALCEPFGLQYRDDVLFDLDQDFHQVIDPPPLEPRAWHGIDFFRLRGPASIRPTSLWTRAVFEADHAKSVRADFSVNNFFPPPRDDPKMKSGAFCIAANASYGRGRVVGWGDSTVFSNFEIFYPGKYEFLLNTLDWLGHREPAMSPMARRISLVALICGAAAVMVLWRRPGVWLGVAATSCAGLLAGWTIARWDESRTGAFPVPVEPSRWVFFAADAKDPSLNLRGFAAEGPYDQRYEVFTQWVLRTGAMSAFNLPDGALCRHLEGSGNARVARAMIVRKPADLGQLSAAGAGPVLLMFSSSVDSAAAVAAVRRAGLLDATAAEAIAAAWPAGETLVDAGGRRVLVVAGAERFSDQMMGISEKVVPDAAQRALFGQAFGLIDRLFDSKPPASP